MEFSLILIENSRAPNVFTGLMVKIVLARSKTELQPFVESDGVIPTLVFFYYFLQVYNFVDRFFPLI